MKKKINPNKAIRVGHSHFSQRPFRFRIFKCSANGLTSLVGLIVHDWESLGKASKVLGSSPSLKPTSFSKLVQWWAMA